MDSTNEAGGNVPPRRAEQDREDLQNEIAGRDVGRMRRFLSETEWRQAAGGSRGNKRDEGSLLRYLLLNDPEYAALYNETMDDLRRAEAATEAAMAKAAKRLSEAKQVLTDILDRAGTLPDGTKVFRDARGKVWTAEGDAVTGDDLERIEWPSGAPDYEEYRASKEVVEGAESDIDELRHYQVDVLGRARDRLSDEDNPLSKDELKDIQNRISEAAPFGKVAKPEPHTELDHDIPTTSASVKPPPLGG